MRTRQDPTGRFQAGAGYDPVPVILLETPDHLEIRDPMALLVAAWSWADIVTHRRADADQPFRYTCRLFPEQWVETHDPGFLTERLDWEAQRTDTPPLPTMAREKPAPRPPRRAWRWPSLRALGRGLAVALGTLLVGALLGMGAMALPGLANRLAALVPTDTERVWGTSLVLDLRDHGALFCDNIYGTQALERLVSRLAAPLSPPWPIRVHVVKDPRAQVLTLPGGQIILFEGLVKSVRTPDEIAGLLAHAIAHGLLHHDTDAIVSRHGLPALTALLRGDLRAPELSLESLLAVKDADLTRELDADALAVEALLGAGLRAHGLPLALEWMETRPADMRPLGRGELNIPPQNALHPPHGDRLHALRRAPRGGGDAMDDLDWSAFKLVCR